MSARVKQNKRARRKTVSKEEVKGKLKELYEIYSKEKLTKQEELAVSGSNRIYIRHIGEGGGRILGVYNKDIKENEAYYSYTLHFLKEGLGVPKLLFIDESRRYYFIEDLGDTSLYNKVLNIKEGGYKEGGLDVVERLYEAVIRDLLRIQLKVGDGIDYSVSYPSKRFDKPGMLRDLNYFKYYFVKFHDICFNEERLDEDFRKYASELLEVGGDEYFMYRDFQSRNILVKNKGVGDKSVEGEEIYYIDYQGGRLGSKYYDIGSLLYDSQVGLDYAMRERLFRYYAEWFARESTNVETIEAGSYYKYVLLRLLQAFGAYGYRGLYEGKIIFIESIPYGIKDLKYVLRRVEIMELLDGRKELKKVLEGVCELAGYERGGNVT